ncbi:hypothetical protein [Aquimarina litoralis]|uniref:hypothetical protein n=1 Tax=Aquimarina litoralis TaxID=584605 RepID=UPI001C55CA80|nr:hypothetical protein [Aquimarina litoralis]MBW1297498.1 hypothetical protein [Aquimarina litoralis]
MKKLIVLAVAILTSTQIFANDKKAEETNEQKLRSEIALLLKRPEIKLDTDEIKANIEFIVNTNGEIVILTVDSEKEAIEEYVKFRLNYKKVGDNINKTGNKVFKLKLKVLNPEA